MVVLVPMIINLEAKVVLLHLMVAREVLELMTIKFVAEVVHEPKVVVEGL